MIKVRTNLLSSIGFAEFSEVMSFFHHPILTFGIIIIFFFVNQANGNLLLQQTPNTLQIGHRTKIGNSEKYSQA